MRRAYLGISRSNRNNFEQEIAQIKRCLNNHQIDLFVFVDFYQFAPDQEKEMMKKAFEEIDQSDLLIVELTKKAIGVGVEVGYAYGRGIPIIYLRKSGSKYSTTVGGCASRIIEYDDEIDLGNQLDVGLNTD